MGAPRIKDAVLRYIARHPGVTVWRTDIAKDLGFTEAQVTNAISGAVRRDGPGEAANHVVVVEYGRAWRWSETPIEPLTGKTATGKTVRLFEEVATIPDGRVLVKGDDGKVYWLTEV